MLDVPQSVHSEQNDDIRDDGSTVATGSCVRLHLQTGWWSLLLFLCFGIVLETLHGFKQGWYLDVGQETRRLMWTLAHAHGTLISLVHIAFAFTISTGPGIKLNSMRVASRCLLAGGILMPAGFFLGGLYFREGSGDPGLGILLVPAGAGLLLVGVLLTAMWTNAFRIANKKQR